MGTTRDTIKHLLLDAGAEKLPTSSVGRLGRMAVTMLKGSGLVLAGRKRGDTDVEPTLDPEKLAGMIQSIAHLKGVAMKMGQIMSYIDMALPAEMRDAMAALQTHAQPMPFETVEAEILSELGARGEELLAHMERRPIAAASIGQVHRSRLPGGEPVAVKIQYPSIAKAIESDFRPAAVGTKMATLLYPQARFDDFIKEAKDRFLEECDYLHEAYCQSRFAEIYADHPVLSVPTVYPSYCSRMILSTAFIDGMSFDQYLDSAPSEAERNRVGEALFEFYLGSLFRHQIYNCDPHPGNYLFHKGGRVTMLDHGCTREFNTRFVAKLAQLTRAIHSDERGQIHRALVDLNIATEHRPYDYEMLRGFLRSFYGPMLEDRVQTVTLGTAMEMRDVVKNKKKLAKFPLPGEFLFLFRIRFGLMSVLARLGASANWYQLEKNFVDSFLATHPVFSSPTE